jgi:hypothetical protein
MKTNQFESEKKFLDGCMSLGRKSLIKEYRNEKLNSIKFYQCDLNTRRIVQYCNDLLKN